MVGRRTSSYAADKEALLTRLRKMEGQVRGVQRMVEDDRHCLDLIQQLNALTAAAREVELLLVGDHVRALLAEAAAAGDESGEAVKEMLDVLRAALR